MSDGESVDQEKRTTLRQFAALGAVSPLAGLLDTDSDKRRSNTGQAILGYLSTTPAAHFSKIRDDLSLGTGETQHHLRQLIDVRAVESYADGEYRRYVPANRFSESERLILGYLRRDTPRRVLIGLLTDPTVSGTGLAASIGVSKSTVSRTISDLEAVDLVRREGDYVVQSPETIITLVLRYSESFGSDAQRFANQVPEMIRYEPNAQSER